MRQFDYESQKPLAEQIKKQDFFCKSEILKGIQPYLVYYNLPDYLLEQDQAPTRVVNQSGKLRSQDVVNYFEDAQEEQAKWPNLLIFEVEEVESGQKNVIVGFNSCGWTEQEYGNQNCFLLNVTQNIRFEPIRQLKGYQATYTMVKDAAYTDEEGRQCSGKNLMFGNNALVI